MPNEFITRNGFISKQDSVISGSLTTTGGLTGSILSASYSVTASYSQNAQTASYVALALSASYASSSTSASYALTASANLNTSLELSQRATPGLGYLTPNWCYTEVTGSFTSIPGLDNILLSPILIYQTCTLSALGLTFASTSSSTTATAQLGIYTDNGSMFPYTLVSGTVGDFGTITSSLSSLQYIEKSPSSTITLQGKNIYWIAVVGDTALNLPVPKFVNCLYNPLLQVTITASAPIGGVHPVMRNITSYGIVSSSVVTSGLPTTMSQTTSSYTVNSYSTASSYIGPILKVTY